jgi:hypothetical protein
MIQKRVCIVIFTDKRLYNSVYKSACEQDYPETSVLISVRHPDKNLNKHENITAHLNYSRKLAKASDADYFFFVDSDILLPKYAVSNLMKQLEQPPIDMKCFAHLEKQFGKIKYKKKQIIGAWVKLGYSHGKTLWNPSRWIADNTLVSLTNIEKSVVKVDKIGSGCLMMSREVMEKIDWKSGGGIEVNIANGKHAHPCQCVMFGIEAQDLRYDLWMDGSVVCKHLGVERGIFKWIK